MRDWLNKLTSPVIFAAIGGFLVILGTLDELVWKEFHLNPGQSPFRVVLS